MTLQSFVITICGWLVGLPLQFLVITALMRGPYRRFPLVFLYAAAGFVTTLVEIPPFTESFLTGDPVIWRHAARVFWVNECILQVLILAAVISLIDQAASASPSRRVIRAGLIAGAILFPAVSFYIRYQPLPQNVGYWMTPWTRDINLCATILDLALWMMLVASRKGDRRLLMISGALGLQFTGEAIGHTLRNLSMAQQMQALSLIGAVIVMLADLTCLYLWWQTFRVERLRSTPQT